MVETQGFQHPSSVFALRFLSHCLQKEASASFTPHITFVWFLLCMETSQHVSSLHLTYSLTRKGLSFGDGKAAGCFLVVAHSSTTGSPRLSLTDRFVLGDLFLYS